MSDRLIISLATIPMISGVMLLGVLRRPAASQMVSARSTASQNSAGARTDTRMTAWVGVVSAGSNAELAAEFDGRVTRVWVKSGQAVRQGDPLLEIDAADIETTVGLAGAELSQRRSDVVRAEVRLQAAEARLARLQAGGAWLSAQEVDTARTEARVAAAELVAARSSVAIGRARLAQQKLRAEKHRIEAPFSGTLASVDVDQGDSVGAGQVLARIISEDRVIRFALPRAEIANKPLTQVIVRLNGHAGALRAPVNAVRPEVDAAAQLVFATAALPMQAHHLPDWIPGSVVDVSPAPESAGEQLLVED